jgi:5-methylcytosine-specific restriction endonuclease McrA
MDIEDGQLCDSGCGNPAKYFSEGTGRYRCLKSANSCPANKAKNRAGLRKAHAEGRGKKWTDEDRKKSHIAHRRKLIEAKPFEELGHKLRKKIVLEDQDYKCLHCENDMWMGLRITLELDHIDGDRNNHKRENTRCLCPNCHSITDTWKTGNVTSKNRRKATDQEIIDAFKEHKSLTKTLEACNMNWGSGETIKKVLFKHKIID